MAGVVVVVGMGGVVPRGHFPVVRSMLMQNDRQVHCDAVNADLSSVRCGSASNAGDRAAGTTKTLEAFGLGSKVNLHGAGEHRTVSDQAGIPSVCPRKSFHLRAAFELQAVGVVAAQRVTTISQPAVLSERRLGWHRLASGILKMRGGRQKTDHAMRCVIDHHLFTEVPHSRAFGVYQSALPHMLFQCLTQAAVVGQRGGMLLDGTAAEINDVHVGGHAFAAEWRKIHQRCATLLQEFEGVWKVGMKGVIVGDGHTVIAEIHELAEQVGGSDATGCALGRLQ